VDSLKRQQKDNQEEQEKIDFHLDFFIIFLHVLVVIKKKKIKRMVEKSIGVLIWTKFL